MLKILLSPTRCHSHAILCQELHAMLMDSLAVAGYEVVTWQSEKDFDDACCLLMIGVGEWGISEHGAMLSAAGKRGIRRVFWQMETLPPPDLPRSRLVDLLLRQGPERTTGLRRFLERVAYQRLARQCRDRAWNADHIFDPRRFSLPFREARKLIALWHARLVDEIVVSLGTRQEFLAARGVPARFMPFGYNPLLGHPLTDVARDLDVVFLGTRHPRRVMLLDQIERGLKGHGYRLTIVDKACYGEERTRLLNRAKILLFLRNYPWEMPRLRMIMAMGCKATIVTEPFGDTAPFRPGKHFVMSPPLELLGTLLSQLENDQGRQEMSERAYAFVNQSLRLDELLGKALQPGPATATQSGFKKHDARRI